MAEPHPAVFSNGSLIDGEYVHGKLLIGPVYAGKFPTFGDLPEDVVLEIFYFHMLSCPRSYEGSLEWQREWHKLIHVCRQWRTIIFASQRRLELQLFCTPKTLPKTPITQTLNLWPAFPIVVQYGPCMTGRFSDDRISSALQQRDRVCEVSLRMEDSQFVIISQLMQETFPLLEYLELESGEATERVLPSTFLGGSAPRLRVLRLDGITFPALPRLRVLSSAGDLVHLMLQERGPRTEYISPEALVSGLSATTRLKTLRLYFFAGTGGTFRSTPLGRNTPPPSSGRIAFPTLIDLSFNGTSKYLEDLLSRITAPSLKYARISFFKQPSCKGVSQLSQFLGRVELQSLPDLVEVSRHNNYSSSLSYPLGASPYSDWLNVTLCVPVPQLELSLITHIFQQISPMLSSVRSLKVETSYQPPGINEDVEHWLGLLRVFNHVRKIVFLGGATPDFACALQQVSAEKVADVLPALREFIIKPDTSESRKAVKSFLDARNRAGLPAIKVRCSAND